MIFKNISKSKLTLAFISIVITFFVWQQGLRDSLNRPSVTFDISQKEQEIVELSLQSIPVNLKKFFIIEISYYLYTYFYHAMRWLNYHHLQIYIMTIRLVLVRHGLSSFNAKGLIQGRTDDSLLTDEGYEQAQKAGKAK